MVELTKYNEQKFLLNCDLIETIEETDYELLTETTRDAPARLKTSRLR